MRNLTELTGAERADSIGLWADVTGAKAPFESRPVVFQAIIYNTGHPSSAVEETMVLEPGMGVMTVKPSAVTPRFDLPRAWNLNGTPPRGQWQRLSDPHFQQEQRRWVGEWE